MSVTFLNFNICILFSIPEWPSRSGLNTGCTNTVNEPISWSGSERDLAVPCKRRRRGGGGYHSDDDAASTSSRSSSLIQFESLERRFETESGPNSVSSHSNSYGQSHHSNDYSCYDSLDSSFSARWTISR